MSETKETQNDAVIEVAKSTEEMKEDVLKEASKSNEEAPKTTNGSSSTECSQAKDDPKLPGRIVRQVEHYFGNYNLPRDKFLRAQTEENEGWIPIETMLKFKRLHAMTDDPKTILEALKTSSKLIHVDMEKQRVRRDPDNPLPKWTSDETAKKEHMLNTTVYLKGFDKLKTTLDELINFFQDSYEGVANVVMRSYVDKKDEDKKKFKGSVFVNFVDEESAKNFMKLESVKNDKGEELIKKWQKDYFEEKEKEYLERKKQRDEKRNKKGNKGDKDKEGKEDDKEEEKKEDNNNAFNLPKGSVLELKNLGSTCSRESIKAHLLSEFEVPATAIAFIYYDKGESDARIRFKEENAAVNLVSKMKEKLKDAEIIIEGEQKSQFGLLEGDEEEAFLKQCVQDIKAMRNRGNKGGHKRKGNWGGQRGGKRGRR